MIEQRSPPDARESLAKLRKAIRQPAPEAREVISLKATCIKSLEVAIAV